LVRVERFKDRKGTIIVEKKRLPKPIKDSIGAFVFVLKGGEE